VPHEHPACVAPHPAGGRIVLALPYAKGTRFLLREVCGPGTRPEFDRARKAWLVARPHFRKVVEALALRYGTVPVTTDHTVRHACDSKCWDAKGGECECHCLGDNYGGGFPRGWHSISGDMAIRN
jgi:hypothetical protein